MPCALSFSRTSGSRFSTDVESRCGQIAQAAGVANTNDRPTKSTLGSQSFTDRYILSDLPGEDS